MNRPQPFDGDVFASPLEAERIKARRLADRLVSSLRLSDATVELPGLRLEPTPRGVRLVSISPREVAWDDASDAILDATDAAFLFDWNYWTRIVADPDRRRWLMALEGYSPTLTPVEARVVNRRLRDDGVQQPVGSLLVTIRRRGDGLRLYDLRHLDDQQRPTRTLELFHQLEDVAIILATDDDGRPKDGQAQSGLRTGWWLIDLGPRDLVTAVTQLSTEPIKAG